MPNIDADDEFAMLLTAPDAYTGTAKRSDVPLARRTSSTAAARLCDLTSDDVGTFGVARRFGRVTKRIGRVSSRAGRAALRAHPLAVTTKAARLAAKGVAVATGPIRRRIFRAFFGKLTNRRARLLAWQARRTLRPNALEAAAARRWAVAYIKRRGLLGKLAAGSLAGDDAIGEPASAALATASIPVLIELARRALRVAERQGAPADPRGVEHAASDEAEQGA